MPVSPGTEFCSDALTALPTSDLQDTPASAHTGKASTHPTALSPEQLPSDSRFDAVSRTVVAAVLSTAPPAASVLRLFCSAVSATLQSLLLSPTLSLTAKSVSALSACTACSAVPAVCGVDEIAAIVFSSCCCNVDCAVAEVPPPWHAVCPLDDGELDT